MPRRWQRYLTFAAAAAVIYLLLQRDGPLAGILPLAPLDSTSGQPINLGPDTGPTSYLDPSGARHYYGPI